jgi:hypothetical protein
VADVERDGAGGGVEAWKEIGGEGRGERHGEVDVGLPGEALQEGFAGEVGFEVVVLAGGGEEGAVGLVGEADGDAGVAWPGEEAGGGDGEVGEAAGEPGQLVAADGADEGGGAAEAGEGAGGNGSAAADLLDVLPGEELFAWFGPAGEAGEDVVDVDLADYGDFAGFGHASKGHSLPSFALVK